MDRSGWYSNMAEVEIDSFIDCHAPRPYELYKESLDRIVDAVYRRLEKELNIK